MTRFLILLTSLICLAVSPMAAIAMPAAQQPMAGCSMDGGMAEMTSEGDDSGNPQGPADHVKKKCCQFGCHIGTSASLPQRYVPESSLIPDKMVAISEISKALASRIDLMADPPPKA